MQRNIIADRLLRLRTFVFLLAIFIGILCGDSSVSAGKCRRFRHQSWRSTAVQRQYKRESYAQQDRKQTLSPSTNAPDAGVKGTVTLNGKPLPSGTIEFSPASDPNRKVKATIRNGKYSIPSNLSPGKNKIIIEFKKSPAESRPSDIKP